ncbi:MAG: DUF2232 domain-containing protein [Desulfobulbaceae bacterium]|nr:DUF2232 domain-containing protein [Desulfobulbaceae bacterium]MCK5339688.1 DUF2232 domain-containing protein [Desulfobulbaceae bacterium]MCK5404248.1 DUF2232 domain-containing protein [Desulfobulbaceae bacterium]
MVDRKPGTNPEQNGLLYGVIATSVVFSVPALMKNFGLLHLLVPLPVFFFLVSMGQQQGLKVITRSALVAGVIATVAGSLPALIMSLCLLPSGFILASSATGGESPCRAGLKSMLSLVAVLTVFWTFHGMFTGMNPYHALQTAVDNGLGATYALYAESSELPAETLLELEAVFEKLKTVIPKIFPGLLLISSISTIWLNLTIGHWLLNKKQPGLSPWRNFTTWRFPENLVWGIILASILLFINVGSLSILGLNILLILIALYFFQGLSVLTSIFDKWSVPHLFRLFVYTLIVIQAFSIFLLAAMGVADIWADFGKIKKNEETPT